MSPEVINFGDDFQQKQANPGEFQPSSMMLFSEKDQIGQQQLNEINPDSQIMSFNMQAELEQRPDIKDQMESMHEKSQRGTVQESLEESNLIGSARNDMEMHFAPAQQIN